MADNIELSQLLDKAKQAQQAWDEWESEGAFDRVPEWKLLYRSTRDAWTLLHRAIIESVPCDLLLKNGETRQIGTAGVLTSDLMMYYSPDKNAKYTFQGTSLKFVCKIEKI